MSKNKSQAKNVRQQGVRQAEKPAAAPSPKKRILLPVLPLFMIAIWVWGTFYYGSVLHVSREYSFWASDIRLMQFVLSQTFGPLRYIGRLLLQLYQYPWLGSVCLALMLGLISWLTGYCMRLSSRWRAIQYVPALACLAVYSYLGLDLFFESEAGYIMGIPFVVLLVLTIWAVMIRSFSRKPMPTLFGLPNDETPRQNLLGLAFVALAFAAIIGFNEWKRPYVRVICHISATSSLSSYDWLSMTVNSELESVVLASSFFSSSSTFCGVLESVILQ
ncbi:MAG: DUF6057 family protein [Bacteroidaceae bacterium]